jgi:hypothetical protein
VARGTSNATPVSRSETSQSVVIAFRLRDRPNSGLRTADPSSPHLGVETAPPTALGSVDALNALPVVALQFDLLPL